MILNALYYLCKQKDRFLQPIFAKPSTAMPTKPYRNTPFGEAYPDIGSCARTIPI